MALLLEEISAPPFDSNPRSARRWLDRLPLGNTRQCCEMLMPTLLSLKAYPMEGRERLELLETCRPAVNGAAQSLMSLVIGKSFPLDKSALKIAKLAFRFHLEAAEAYRETIRSASYAKEFSPDEQAGVVSLALDQLCHCQLRSAQVYETLPSTVWTKAAALYLHAEENELLQKSCGFGREATDTPGKVYERLLLMRMGASGRLGQQAMHALFKKLAEADNRAEVETEATRTVFRFNLAEPETVTPAATDGKQPPGRHIKAAGRLWPKDGREWQGESGQEDGSADALANTLPRLGETVPPMEPPRTDKTTLALGFKAIAMSLRFQEARDSEARGLDYWPSLHEVEFSTLQALPGKWQTSAAALAEDGKTGKDDESIDVETTQLPGYYLLDSGNYLFRVGYLVGLDLSGQWPLIGVVRGGQRHAGRFWHSLEALAKRPRLATVRACEHPNVKYSGFLLNEQAQNGCIGLITAPVKWRSGDKLRIHWAEGDQFFQIRRLVEANRDFCQFEIEEKQTP